MTEAALRYGVPKRKISKLLEQHQLDGARKVRGVHGFEWRIPVAELEARGYRRNEQPADRPDSEAAELQRAVRTLTDAMVQERQLWTDKHRELEDAQLLIGRLKADLRKEQEHNKRLERELADLRHEGTVVDLRDAQDRGQQPQSRSKT